MRKPPLAHAAAPPLPSAWAGGPPRALAPATAGRGCPPLLCGWLYDRPLPLSSVCFHEYTGKGAEAGGTPPPHADADRPPPLAAPARRRYGSGPPGRCPRGGRLRLPLTLSGASPLPLPPRSQRRRLWPAAAPLPPPPLPPLRHGPHRRPAPRPLLAPSPPPRAAVGSRPRRAGAGGGWHHPPGRRQWRPPQGPPLPRRATASRVGGGSGDAGRLVRGRRAWGSHGGGRSLPLARPASRHRAGVRQLRRREEGRVGRTRGTPAEGRTGTAGRRAAAAAPPSPLPAQPGGAGEPDSSRA